MSIGWLVCGYPAFLGDWVRSCLRLTSGLKILRPSPRPTGSRQPRGGFMSESKEGIFRQYKSVDWCVSSLNLILDLGTRGNLYPSKCIPLL